MGPTFAGGWVQIRVAESNVSLDWILPLVEAEEKLAWRFYKEGFVQEFFMTDTPGTVVVIAEASNAAEVHRRFADLPMVKAGVIDCEIVELRPFTNWESLFSNDSLQPMRKGFRRTTSSSD